MRQYLQWVSSKIIVGCLVAKWKMGKKHLHLTEYVNSFFFGLTLVLVDLVYRVDVLKISVAENLFL